MNLTFIHPLEKSQMGTLWSQQRQQLSSDSLTASSGPGCLQARLIDTDVQQMF